MRSDHLLGSQIRTYFAILLFVSEVYLPYILIKNVYFFTRVHVIWLQMLRYLNLELKSVATNKTLKDYFYS